MHNFKFNCNQITISKSIRPSKVLEHPIYVSSTLCHIKQRCSLYLTFLFLTIKRRIVFKVTEERKKCNKT